MKKDLQGLDDVKTLVDAFYIKVKADDVIGYIFTEVVPISWEVHMPVMYQFWDTVLFGTMTYKGNPMTKHIVLDKKEPLIPAHFERWKALFFETVDEHFAGEKAELAKSRADSIGNLMQFKVEQSRSH
jgi:hemoglobin